MGRNAVWNKTSCTGVSEEYVPCGEMLQLLSFSLVTGECPIFEISYDRILHPGDVSRRNISSLDL